MLLFLAAPVPVEVEAKHRIMLTVAEIALVLLLFTDAVRIDLRVLRGNQSLPTRLLVLAMPLIILLGALVAKLVLPQLSFWEAAVLAAVLAPTDAGLGEAVVKNPRVPQRIRQALNVEAGLNDGLAVPFLLLFVGLAQAEAEAGHAAQALVVFMVEQLGFGLLIGLAIGLAGGFLLALASSAAGPGPPWSSQGCWPYPSCASLRPNPLRPAPSSRPLPPAWCSRSPSGKLMRA